jgi:monofunctional biosynthetic peptidoglycan transglycosylase
MNTSMRRVGQLVGMVAVALLALQLFFLLRIAVMVVVPPESTTFQRITCAAP